MTIFYLIKDTVITMTWYRLSRSQDILSLSNGILQ